MPLIGPVSDTTYYAHSTTNCDKSDWQPLRSHLTNVAAIASDFAHDFNAQDLAYTAGLLHDLGKYSQEFQRRLEGTKISVDHSTAGAKECRLRYPPGQSRILEYIITGHHGGLLNYGSRESGLEERLSNTVIPDYSSYKDEIRDPRPEKCSTKLKTGSEKGWIFHIVLHTNALFAVSSMQIP